MPAPRSAALVSAALFILGACTPATTPAPAAVTPQATRTTGYSVSLIRITPEPGTPLHPGARVPFAVTVISRLEVADNGVVVLVLQDRTGRTLTTGRPQAFTPVRRGTTEVTVTDTLLIPHDIDGVQLFIVLAPEGYATTEGEVVRNYPVRQK